MLRVAILMGVLVSTAGAQRTLPPPKKPNGYSFPPRPGLLPKTGLPPKPGAKVTTLLEVQILAPKQGVGLTAQRWQRVFAKIGFPVRIRRARFGDEKAEIKEQTQGTLRYVTAIGKITRDGKLAFPGRSFTQIEGAKLREFLTDLKTFGKQGRPQGKPVWGLNQPQFVNVFNGLAAKLETKIEGKTVSRVLSEFATKHAGISVKAAAKVILVPPIGKGPKVGREYAGFSKGTALAILLREHGLGFFPLRKPDGKIELAIVPNDGSQRVWPIGWDLKATRQKTMPQLFAFVPIDLDKVPLPRVLKAIEDRTKIPMLIDRYTLAQAKVDPEKILVSHRPEKTTWSLLLRAVTFPNRLTRDYRIDEGGRAFVWITKFDPKKR